MNIYKKLLLIALIAFSFRSVAEAQINSYDFYACQASKDYVYAQIDTKNGYDLMYVSAKSDRATKLADIDQFTDIYEIYLSKDASKILVGGSDNRGSLIYVYDFTVQAGLYYSMPNSILDVQISSDGKDIFYVQSNGENEKDAETTIIRWNLEKNEHHVFEIAQLWQPDHLSLKQDGKLLAFSASLRNSDEPRHIYILNLENNQIQDLGIGMFPIFAEPDG